MKVGVLYPIHGPFAGPNYSAPSYAKIKGIVQTAEREGLDSAWITDHLLFRFPPENINIGCQDTFTFWAGIAEATKTIELGSMVLCTAFRNPATLAKMAVSLDEIANHRVTLGLGCGWHEPEFRAFGIPFTNIVSRFEEAMSIIHPLLRKGTVDFQGTYYRASNCDLDPPDTRPGGIPILIASKGERLLDLTARFADQWNAAWFGKPDGYLRRVADLDAACERQGRDPKSIVKTAGVSVRFTDGSTTADHDPAGQIQGTVETLAEGLRAYADAGCDHVIANLVELDEEKTSMLAEAARMAGLLTG
jgi:alkanesulfonate monooxygenase SsuD/methylene tetrahydromethanopterin reductase-like flavin-dependent oxidoreductase (luciferase family)